MTSGGLLIVLLFFSFVGEVNFAYAYVAGILIIFLAAYFFLTWLAFERSELTGNTGPRIGSGEGSRRYRTRALRCRRQSVPQRSTSWRSTPSQRSGSWASADRATVACAGRRAWRQSATSVTWCRASP